jgi:hypothetical protein
MRLADPTSKGILPWNSDGTRAFVKLDAAQSDKGRVMPEMLVTCPTTKRQLSTGIHTDVKSLQKSWKKVLKVNCQLCGEIHEVPVRQAYLEGELEGVATSIARH